MTRSRSLSLGERSSAVFFCLALAACSSGNSPSGSAGASPPATGGSSGSTNTGAGGSVASGGGGANGDHPGASGAAGTSSAGGAGGGSGSAATTGTGGASTGGAAGTNGTGTGGTGGTGGAAGTGGGGAAGSAVADAASDVRSTARDAAPEARVDAPPPTMPVTVFLAGDSIVMTYPDTPSTTDQAGWGQMLPAYFRSNATIDNRAIGGRTARRFIEEGRLADILADIHAGDYLLVQFGTNDGNTTATYVLDGGTIPYFLDPNTDFKTYLMQYVDGARAKSATPVLVTPTPRNSAYCTGGNGTGAYAQAMRDLAAAENIALSDLNMKTVNYLKAICPAPVPENFFLLLADGTVDGTHFQENGARILAGFVAQGIRESGIPLAAYLLN